MGKVKIKRKSTLIDMTAMSDVTVLLLTFFMLTSTFLQKEPTVVNTPSSVSEIKVPMSNLMTVLVSAQDPTKTDVNTEGKVFISFAGDVDSVWSSTNLRVAVLKEAEKLFEEHRGKKLNLTPMQYAEFSKMNMFGVPFENLPTLLDMESTKRDKFQGDMTNPQVGIPIDDNKDPGKNLNDFQIWLQAVQNVAQDFRSQKREAMAEKGASEEEIQNMESLYKSLIRTGEGIAVKADQNTKFEVVHRVFDNLQTMSLNKFSLMTALKSEDEPKVTTNEGE